MENWEKVRQWTWATLHVRWIVFASVVIFLIAPCKGIRISQSGKFFLWNPESGLWNPDYSSRNPYLTNGWNPESGFHAVESRIQEVLTCIPLHVAIHCGTVAKIFHGSFFVRTTRFSGRFLNIFHSKKRYTLKRYIPSTRLFWYSYWTTFLDGVDYFKLIKSLSAVLAIWNYLTEIIDQEQYFPTLHLGSLRVKVSVSFQIGNKFIITGIVISRIVEEYIFIFFVNVMELVVCSWWAFRS